MDNCFQPSPLWQNRMTFSPGDKKLSLFLADYWLTRRRKLRHVDAHIFAHFCLWRRQEGLAKSSGIV
ncbi:hypothetical protein KCP78_02615 [Salmonella enterica subsp. enterica]|nr:hypothetical protein KCP78_02615 [Salmonella enterica subsp. enterica]